MTGTRSSTVVWGAALLATLGRFGGWLWPLRPDEAGFLMVARAWDPRPDALYHPYFVDRPPSLLLVVRWADAIGGPYFLRLVAALGCGVAVLFTASLVREVARDLPHRVEEATLARVSAGAALMTAAFLVTPQVDAISAKGEVLGVPLLVGSCLLALRAARTRSPGWAFTAGLLAMSAVGLKQSLVGGLVHGGVLLAVAWATRRVGGRTFLRLAGAAAFGAAVPVLATVVGTWAAGVELSQVGYAVLGFREDASQVIIEQTNPANTSRLVHLLVASVTTGMVLVALRSLLGVRVALRRVPGPTLAALAMLVGDVTLLVASGSFWRPYLLALVPSLVALWAYTRVATLTPREPRAQPTTRGEGRRRSRLDAVVVGFCVASSVVSLIGWTWGVWWNGAPPREYVLGREIGRVAAVDDTLVVYGGRADLQWASGLESPYPHLWSLPMRTADPDLAQLRGVLAGPDAPTWLVEVVELRAWDRMGAEALRGVVRARYAHVGTYCEDFAVLRLREAPEVEAPAPDCETPWGRR